MKKCYGLFHIKTNKILSFEVSENYGDFCLDVAHELVTHGEKMWLVDSPEHAEWVRLNSTPRYNASYDTPINSFEPEELKVVEVEVIINTKDLSVEIPSFEEMAKFNADGNKNELIYIMKLKKDHPDMFYSLYELKKYLNNKK